MGNKTNKKISKFEPQRKNIYSLGNQKKDSLYFLLKDRQKSKTTLSDSSFSSDEEKFEEFKKPNNTSIPSEDDLDDSLLQDLEKEELFRSIAKEKKCKSEDEEDNLEFKKRKLVQNSTMFDKTEDLSLINDHPIKRIQINDEDLIPIEELTKRQEINYTKLNRTDEEMKNIIKRLKEEYHIPNVVPLDTICDLCKPYLSVVDDLLRGKINSAYYSIAKDIFMNSSTAFLSNTDIRQLDINKFVAGYFGLQRQYMVTQLIIDKYRDKLSSVSSPVIKWWGVEDFSKYILAPEVLISLCISEMKLKKDKDEDDLDLREKAYTIFENTITYGLQAADNEP